METCVILKRSPVVVFGNLFRDVPERRDRRTNTMSLHTYFRPDDNAPKWINARGSARPRTFTKYNYRGIEAGVCEGAVVIGRAVVTDGAIERTMDRPAAVVHEFS